MYIPLCRKPLSSCLYAIMQSIGWFHYLSITHFDVERQFPELISSHPTLMCFTVLLPTVNSPSSWLRLSLFTPYFAHSEKNVSVQLPILNVISGEFTEAKNNDIFQKNVLTDNFGTLSCNSLFWLFILASFLLVF